MSLIDQIPIGKMPVDYIESGTNRIVDILQKARQAAMQQQQMQQTGQYQQQQIKQQQQQLEQAQKLAPLKELLMRAQAQKATSDADWNSMLMGGQGPQGGSQPNFDALKQMMMQMQGQQGSEGNGVNLPNLPPPSGQPPQGMQQPRMQQEKMPQQQSEQGQNGETILRPGNPQLHFIDEHAGLKGIPPVQTMQDNNGNLITRYPSGKVTSTPIGLDAGNMELQKGLAQSAVKKVQELTDNAITGDQLGRTYDSLEKDMSSPVWQQMTNNALSKYGTDWGRNINLKTLENSDNEEQKRLIGRVTANMGKIIADSAGMFKGAFRQGEQGLLENIKPNKTEPVAVSLGKLNALKEGLKFAQEINVKVPQLINKGVPLTEALRQVRDSLGVDKFFDSVEQKFPRQESAGNDFSKMSDDELRKIAGGG